MDDKEDGVVMDHAHFKTIHAHFCP